MSYSRVFENLWGGKRHAMVTPTQIDSFGQTNISAIGDYGSPKVQLLGVRGFQETLLIIKILFSFLIIL
jgi:glutaconate CoA-transferase subunit B